MNRSAFSSEGLFVPRTLPSKTPTHTWVSMSRPHRPRILREKVSVLFVRGGGFFYLFDYFFRGQWGRWTRNSLPCMGFCAPRILGSHGARPPPQGAKSLQILQKTKFVSIIGCCEQFCSGFILSFGFHFLVHRIFFHPEQSLALFFNYLF